MARLESEGKGGYYPTPIEEMKLILKRVTSYRDDHVTILDPCSGEGIALQEFKNHLEQNGTNVTSYGIELEKNRAIESKKRLDYVENCSYDEIRMTNNSVSAMYLNPPFMSLNGERMELRFLRDLTQDRLSEENGLLIFNLPQYVLKDCASIIASRFVDVQVYRFTDKNYDLYKQVIVYGYRRRKGLKTASEREYELQLKHHLEKISALGKNAVPALDEEDSVLYHVTPANKMMETFMSTRVEEDDILDSLKSEYNDFFEQVKNKTSIGVTSSGSLVAAMELKVAHTAAALEAGLLPEQMGSDHLICPQSYVQKTEKIQTNEKSQKEEKVEVFSTKTQLHAFTEKGIFILGA